MTKKEYLLLVEKIADGTANDAEIALYNATFDAFQKNDECQEQLGLNFVKLEQESLDRFYKTIEVAEFRSVMLWPKIGIIAAALAAMVFGLWFFTDFNTFRSTEPDSASSLANEIKPGKNSATLTLGDGKTVQLSGAKDGVIIADSMLKYNDGSVVTYSAKKVSGFDQEQLTAATPRGGMYQITLPDGTRVWLNSATAIRFPKSFAGKKERVIELDGEAYFEVATSFISVLGTRSKQAFIVKSNGQQVEVLGTHFNIHAYQHEMSKTTLLEGAVRVAISGNKRLVTLVPGQQSVLNKGKLTVLTADTEEVLSWKNGYFKFNDEDITHIMRKIERWYNVEVVYEGAVSREEFKGTISRSKNLSEVLDLLESTKMIRFKVEGRRVTVMQ